jgi:hypothetical protein
MEIDDAKDVVVEILLADPVTDGAQIVTEVNPPGWLDSGKNALSLDCHPLLHFVRNSPTHRRHVTLGRDAA